MRIYNSEYANIVSSWIYTVFSKKKIGIKRVIEISDQLSIVFFVKTDTNRFYSNPIYLFFLFLLSSYCNHHWFS